MKYIKILTPEEKKALDEYNALSLGEKVYFKKKYDRKELKYYHIMLQWKNLIVEEGRKHGFEKKCSEIVDEWRQKEFKKKFYKEVFDED